MALAADQPPDAGGISHAFLLGRRRLARSALSRRECAVAPLLELSDRRTDHRAADLSGWCPDPDTETRALCDPQADHIGNDAGHRADGKRHPRIGPRPRSSSRSFRQKTRSRCQRHGSWHARKVASAWGTLSTPPREIAGDCRINCRTAGVVDPVASELAQHVALSLVRNPKACCDNALADVCHRLTDAWVAWDAGLAPPWDACGWLNLEAKGARS